MVLWDIMYLVCIAGYCPHFSFNMTSSDVNMSTSSSVICSHYAIAFVVQYTAVYVDKQHVS